MLQPLGESRRGSGPRIRAARARRDSSRLRAVIVLVVLIVGSTFGVWLILRADASKAPPQAQPAPCVDRSGANPHGKAPTKAPVKAAARPDIRIRVLNATSRPGLARTVAAELRRRGYTVTGVGNDSSPVPGPAVMRYGAAGAPKARAVAGLVAGAVNRQIVREGTDIDLILGNTFTRLGPAFPPAKSGGCPASATPKR